MHLVDIEPGAKGKSIDCIRGYTSFMFLIAIGFVFSLSAQDTILIIRPNGVHFDHVVKGMVEDFGTEMVVVEKKICEGTKTEDVLTALKQYNPKAVVLMDNTVIRLYKQCIKEFKSTFPKIPVIALMAILVGDAIQGIENAAAISYEVPIVTSSIILRSLSGNSLKKIGVVHRDIMTDLVESGRKSCAQEKIAIVNRCVECKGGSKAWNVKKAVRDLLKKENVDALWLPNDNFLLSKDLLVEVWIPMINKYKKPVVVGVEVLASPILMLGTLAVMPDHEALGVQAAQMISNISDDGWEVSENRIEPALSVKKVLNYKQAKDFLGVSEKKLLSVDKVLK